MEEGKQEGSGLELCPFCRLSALSVSHARKSRRCSKNVLSGTTDLTRMAEKAPRDNISRHACMGFSPPSSARETPLTQIARVPRGDISLPCCNTFFVPSHKAKAFVLECKTREILSRLQAQRGTGLCVLIPPRNHKLSVNFFISHESAHAGQRESYKNSTQPNQSSH